jgi:rod shape determining protein RodA
MTSVNGCARPFRCRFLIAPFGPAAMSPALATSPSPDAQRPVMTSYRPPVVRRTDWVMPMAMLLLSMVGVLFIRSAQSNSGGTQWLQQLVWLALGAGLYATVSALDYHVWFKHAHLVYIAALVLLFLLWTPLGEVRSGARRWLGVGSYTIQPSEFAKIGTLLMVASILAREELGSFRESLAMLGKVALAVAAPIVLIFLQPDLGSSLVFFPMIFAQLYVSKLSARFFATVFVLFLLGVAILGGDIYHYKNYLQQNQLTPTDTRNQYEKQSWLPLKNYQRNRIVAFMFPEVVDPQGIGATWQQAQSLIAVGSGGLTGKGYEKGTLARLGYLPAVPATNDFIMAVFLEETGFLGGLFVLGLYAILIGNTLRIAGLARDRFGQLLGVGVAVIFMVHVFVNIGMVQGLMPVKGIPLPLMSYGGSFVLACGILLGLVQSVYRFRREAV